MMRRSLAVAVAVAALTLTSSARADLVVGAGLSGNFGLGEEAVQLPTSLGLNALVGFRLGLGVLELTPELELTYLGALESLGRDRVSWALQVLGGGRAGVVLGGWVPSAYVHFGLGRVDVAEADVDYERTGPAVEVGAALDYRAFQPLTLGVQVGLSGVRLREVAGEVDNIKWVRAGVHASLVF
jgi:hypothetical protein